MFWNRKSKNDDCLEHEVYLLRVNYKSGNVGFMYAYEFSYNANGITTEVNWKAADIGLKPVVFSVGEVESVYQVDYWPEGTPVKETGIKHLIPWSNE